MKIKVLFVIFSVVFLIFTEIGFAALPIPHPLPTTSLPPLTTYYGQSEKVLEINFTINSNNQINLNSISTKNLPQAIVTTSNNDYYLEITDANNKILFQSNILVIFNSQNISQQYYAIPYPNGATYLYFYYQNQQIAKYNIPQEFPWFYVIIGISIVIVLIVIYYITRNYTIQI